MNHCELEALDLVAISMDRLVTDSRKVAERFGKRHGDVLRAIRNLETPSEFNERNFASVEYRKRNPALAAGPLTH